MFNPFKKKRQNRDVWCTAEGKENGLPAIFRFRESPPSKPQDYPFRVCLHWQFEHNGSGLPDAETNSRQIELEDLLECIDGAGLGWLMLVATGNSRKEWVWYVANIEEFMKSLNHALKGESPFPIDISFEKDSEWSMYGSFVGGVSGL